MYPMPTEETQCTTNKKQSRHWVKNSAMAQPRHNSRQIGHDRLLLEQNPFSSPPLRMMPRRILPINVSSHMRRAVRSRESRVLLKTVLLPTVGARPSWLGSFP